MNAFNAVPLLLVLSLAAFTLVDAACAPTGIDEDALVSTAPSEHVQAFALLDSLQQADGGLLLYFARHAFDTPHG